ncbi:MAG: hypothetical protein KKF77_03455 [Proteobacteria bacterium]|nr:hypothetical protein [Pseudomonadota bacterium]
MTQAKGYQGKTVIDFETSFGVVPSAGSRKGYSIPFMSNTLAATVGLTKDETLTGRRDPVEPGQGNVDVPGSLKVPVDAHNYGLHLRSMFGLPTTVVVASLLLNAAAAVNKGGGKVGLPCTAHGLASGAPVVIVGSTNYDGAYLLDRTTSTNELVIAATYTAETFAGDETVSLARQVVIDGVVRLAGGGKVGLPAVAHGLPVGARIVVDGTTNYDATYTVLRGTSANELLVTATNTAETVSDATATAAFYDHVFKVGDTMPSILAEKAFPAIPVYYIDRGLKVSKLDLSFGGEGVLSSTMIFVGAGEDDDTTQYDAAAVELPIVKFNQKDVSLTEGGVAYSNRVKTVSLSLDFGLETDTYTLNTPDKAGERGDITEGLLGLEGNLEALFTGTDLVDKAIDNTTSSLAVLASNKGYELEVTLEELKYERTTPPIDGPKGVLERHKFMPFYASGAANSSVVVRLRNEMYSLEQ